VVDLRLQVSDRNLGRPKVQEIKWSESAGDPMTSEHRRAVTTTCVYIVSIRDVMWFEKLDAGMHRNPAHAHAYLFTCEPTLTSLYVSRYLEFVTFNDV